MFLITGVGHKRNAVITSLWETTEIFVISARGLGKSYFAINIKNGVLHQRINKLRDLGSVCISVDL